jgi:hypothetical protein
VLLQGPASRSVGVTTADVGTCISAGAIGYEPAPPVPDLWTDRDQIGHSRNGINLAEGFRR